MYLKTEVMKMMCCLLGWDLSHQVPRALRSTEAEKAHGGEKWGLAEAERSGCSPGDEKCRGEGSWMRWKHTEGHGQGRNSMVPRISATTKLAGSLQTLSGGLFSWLTDKPQEFCSAPLRGCGCCKGQKSHPLSSGTFSLTPYGSDEAEMKLCMLRVKLLCAQSSPFPSPLTSHFTHSGFNLTKTKPMRPD